jgi:hypothetical protein
MVMKRPMVAFLTQLLLAIRSRFTRRARLEAENLLLRQQLVLLRRKSPTRVRLWNIDRLPLVWLYRPLELRARLRRFVGWLRFGRRVERLASCRTHSHRLANRFQQNQPFDRLGDVRVAAGGEAAFDVVFQR